MRTPERGRSAELFARATDPTQYDGPDLDWAPEGDAEAPFARYVRERLEPALGSLRDRSVLDIGCGTGHLAELFERLGARRMVGLEPSARHARLAKRLHPRLSVVRGAVPRAPLRAGFDVAIAVLSFEHQPDLDPAYRAVAGLLRADARFLLIAGDPLFHRAPRWGLGLEVIERADGSALVATTYPVGTVHDVIRPPDHFERAARGAGFATVRSEPLVPDNALMDRDARWREFSGRPVAWLITATMPGQ
jgi:SAM-dependent methyltransferase